MLYGGVKEPGNKLCDIVKNPGNKLDEIVYDGLEIRSRGICLLLRTMPFCPIPMENGLALVEQR